MIERLKWTEQVTRVLYFVFRAIVFDEMKVFWPVGSLVITIFLPLLYCLFYQVTFTDPLPFVGAYILGVLIYLPKRGLKLRYRQHSVPTALWAIYIHTKALILGYFLVALGGYIFSLL